MRNSIYLVFQKINNENLYLIYSAPSFDKAEGFALKYAMKHAVGGKFKSHNQENNGYDSNWKGSMQTLLSFESEGETDNKLTIVPLEIGKRYPLDSEEILKFSA